MGGSLKNNGRIMLRTSVPRENARIRLIRNGEVVSSVEGSVLEFEAKEGGIYRSEVYLNQNAWIFSNHIRIDL
jgi:hypothetical protein